MAFSEKSEFVSLKGETLEQKVQCVKSVGWGMNTNLQAAFEHVLETARDHDVPPEEMPKALIVVSDMEIDACVDENWMFYDHMKEKYEYSGYRLPNVVFWNVNSRHDLSMSTAKEKGFSCTAESRLRHSGISWVTSTPHRRKRWNRSSKASGMRVSEQGMWKKRCKVVIGKQDVGE